jgi:5-methylcytosine-specific restriction endonuclease McrA
MRWIDIGKLRPPEAWSAKAKAALDAVSLGEDPNNYGAVWRELKNGLAELLHDKCWYCEVPVERSDNAVDHFRPKGRVRDAAHDHGGYRWLAFDLTNFRYACTFCNSRRKDVDDKSVGGKADRFPLVDESKRLYAAGPLDQEAPTLLDPLAPNDCQLLGCQGEDGRPCATSTDHIKKLRAEVSIQIYHLHYEPTCKRRHAAAVSLLADLEQGKRQFLLASQDAHREPDFQAVAQRLLRAISHNSAFSGDMRFIMRGQRSGAHPWIQDLLEA